MHSWTKDTAIVTLRDKGASIAHDYVFRRVLSLVSHWLMLAHLGLWPVVDMTSSEYPIDENFGEHPKRLRNFFAKKI